MVSEEDREKSLPGERARGRMKELGKFLATVQDRHVDLPGGFAGGCSAEMPEAAEGDSEVTGKISPANSRDDKSVIWRAVAVAEMRPALKSPRQWNGSLEER